MSPAPPLEMHSPQLAYQIFYLIFAAQLVGALVWLVVHSVRTHSRLPVIAFAGSLFVGYFTPPVFNHLLMTWFPSNIPCGEYHCVRYEGSFLRLLGYALYFGLGGYLMMRALQRGGVAGQSHSLLWSSVSRTCSTSCHFSPPACTPITGRSHWLSTRSRCTGL